MSFENKRATHISNQHLWWCCALMISCLGFSDRCAGQEGTGEGSPGEALAWAKENLKAGRYSEAVAFYRKAVAATKSVSASR